MDSLSDILKNRQPTVQPEEAVRVTTYIAEKYGQEVQILSTQKHLVVTVSSAAFAATLHMQKQDITSSCNLSKELRFIIGS